MMKNKLYFLLIICLLTAGCSHKKNKKEEDTPRREIPVKVISASSTLSNEHRRYSGTIKENKSSILSFEAAGNIKEITVEKGDKVKKGQLLAKLDQNNLQSLYNAANATANQAQDAYNRYKILYDNGSLPEIKWVEVQTKLQQAKSAQQIARNELKNSSLYAPFDGYIAEKDAEPGMNVVPGAPVVKLVTIDSIYAKISIPENEIAAIQTGDSAIVEIAAIQDKKFEGKVTEKGVMANPFARTYDVLIRIDNPEEQILPGMVCYVDLILSGSDASYINVPNNAIQVDEHGRYFVWVAENNTAHRRFIQTGQQTDSGVSVTSGLNTDDQVIIEGSNKVSEGMKIVIQ